MFAPSEIPCGLTRQPVTAMTEEEIAGMVTKFVEGAVRCQKAGVDGVLIHAAHGYLINQFLSPYTNHRADRYGGSVENRARFALEIIRGIRSACGPDYPVGIRISACEYLDYIGLPREQGITLELAREYAKMFQAAGVDLLDVSSGIYETMNTAWEPVGFSQGWKAELARELKKAVDIPVVCTALIRDPDYAQQLLEEGACDFIGSARDHLADSEWANKAIEQRDSEIRPCISCLNCMKSMAEGDMHCAVNPQGACELARSDIREDGAGRLTVVVGGGPAGMEAARVLALRGFQVKLFDKGKRLGGALLQAAAPPHKESIRQYVDYMVRELDRLGVSVELCKEVTPQDVAALSPYAVLLAVGAHPMVPASIPGIHRENVCTAADVLTGAADLRNRDLVVIGAGMVGLETAEYLQAQGNRVSVYERLSQVATGEHFQNIIDIEKRLEKVPQHLEHTLVEIQEHACLFETKDGPVTVPCDGVVLAMGMAPAHETAEAFSGMANCQTIGTCVSYGNIAYATDSAFQAASQLV
jgi:thioredoxin reductase